MHTQLGSCHDTYTTSPHGDVQVALALLTAGDSQHYFLMAPIGPAAVSALPLKSSTLWVVERVIVPWLPPR